MTPEQWAAKVYPEPIRPFSSSPDGDCLRGIADVIRSAVAEEREACAAIADNVATGCDLMRAAGTSCAEHMAQVARNVATRIRRGTE